MSVSLLRQLLMKEAVKKSAGSSGIMTINKNIAADVEKLVQKYVSDAMQQGVDLDTLGPEQLKMIVAMNAKATNRVISGSSPEGRAITEKLFGKQKAPVVDMTGKTIDTSQGIMGGKSVKELMESGQVQKGSDGLKVSEKITNRDMFKNSSLNKVDTVTDTITYIKTLDPMDAMKEANSVIGRKGKYKNLTPEESKKILTDTEDHIFERDIPIDPEDMAKGGRAGYAVGNQVMPAVDQRMNVDYNTLVDQNTAQRGTETQNRLTPSIFQAARNKFQNFGNKLTSGVEGAIDYTIPAVQGLKSVFTGAGEPIITDSMRRDLIQRAEAKGGDSGFLGYEDYGLTTSSPGARFRGGITDIISDPQAFANAATLGRVTYNKNPETGEYDFGDTNYDFNIADTDKGFGANFLRGINEGGLKTAIPNLAKDLFSSSSATAAEPSAMPQGSPGQLNPVPPGEQNYFPVYDGELGRYLTEEEYTNRSLKQIAERDKPTMADVAGPSPDAAETYSEYKARMLDTLRKSSNQKTTLTDLQSDGSYSGTSRELPQEDYYNYMLADAYGHGFNPNTGLQFGTDDRGVFTDKYKFNQEMADFKKNNPDYNFVGLASGGRAGYYGGGQAMVGEDLSEIGHGSDSLMARNMQLAPNGQATTSTGLNYLLGQDNDTVRVPYAAGGGGRRAFLKMLGLAGAGVAGVKSGIIGLGEGGAKKAVTETVKQAAGSGGQVPPYFLKLVSKIKTLGDDVTSKSATKDREVVKQYKDFEMTEDVTTGEIQIFKRSQSDEAIDRFASDNATEEVFMRYKPGKGQADETTKGKKIPDEYEENTSYISNKRENTGEILDDVDGVPDSVVMEVEAGSGNVPESFYTGPNAIKKADGGRIGFSGGGILRAIIAKSAASKGLSVRDFIKATNYKGLPPEVRRYISPEDFAALKGGQKEMYDSYIDMAKTRKSFQEQVELGKGTPAKPLFDNLEQTMDEKSFVPKTVTSDDIAEIELMVKNRFNKGRKDNAQGGIQTMLGE